MFETNAHVRIPTPQRHALHLAKHFEQRVSVQCEVSLMHTDFPHAACELRRSDVNQEARGEELVINWTGSGEHVVAGMARAIRGHGR